MMLSPSTEHFPRLLIRSLQADTLTPVAAALLLNTSDMMLFESVLQGAERGRYSCIIAGYRDILRIHRVNTPEGDVQERIRRFAKQSTCYAIPKGLPSVTYGVYGAISYDGIRAQEYLPDANTDTIDADDVFLVLPETVLLFDNATDTLRIIAPVDSAEEVAEIEQYIDNIEQILFRSASPSPLQIKDVDSNAVSEALRSGRISNHISQDTFEHYVRQCKEYILAGDAFQIVPSQRFSADIAQDKAFTFYRSLRALNPSPYCFYIGHEHTAITGCSPETLVRLEDGVLHMRPIAGTRPRGADSIQDRLLADELLADDKERAEHLMLVDLCRNDIGRVSEAGTVTVPESYVVELYSHVMHIVSHVTGRIRQDIDAVDALFAALPVGTVSGAPKVRAMEIIDELEQERRGFYAGGAGYISANGSAEFCITLRSAIIKDGRIYFQAGAGIVADSDATAEYKETIHKASALFQAYLRI